MRVQRGQHCVRRREPLRPIADTLQVSLDHLGDVSRDDVWLVSLVDRELGGGQVLRQA